MSVWNYKLLKLFDWFHLIKFYRWPVECIPDSHLEKENQHLSYSVSAHRKYQTTGVAFLSFFVVIDLEGAFFQWSARNAQRATVFLSVIQHNWNFKRERKSGSHFRVWHNETKGMPNRKPWCIRTTYPNAWRNANCPDVSCDSRPATIIAVLFCGWGRSHRTHSTFARKPFDVACKLCERACVAKCSASRVNRAFGKLEKKSSNTCSCTSTSIISPKSVFSEFNENSGKRKRI